MCNSRFKPFLMELLVHFCLISMASFSLYKLFGLGDLSAIEFLSSIAVSVALIRVLLKFDSYQRAKDISSKHGLESSSQVMRRCQKEIHDIAISLICAIAVIGFFSAIMLVRFLLSVTIGFSDWLNAVT